MSIWAQHKVFRDHSSRPSEAGGLFSRPAALWDHAGKSAKSRKNIDVLPVSFFTISPQVLHTRTGFNLNFAPLLAILYNGAVS